MAGASPELPIQVPGLRIGEISSRSGVSVKTIRFYCDQGLLVPVSRSAAGYRLFHPDCLGELEVIRALRVMDVPLSELRQILDVRRSGTCNCAVVKGSITDKIKSIDARVEELLATKAELARLLAMWRDCGGAKTSA